jgi:hypothetical protein
VLTASRAQLMVRTGRPSRPTPKSIASYPQSLFSLKALCKNGIDGKSLISAASGAPLAPRHRALMAQALSAPLAPPDRPEGLVGPAQS